MKYLFKVEDTNIHCKRAIRYPENNSTTLDLVLMILESLSEENDGNEFTIINPPFMPEQITLEDGRVIPYESRQFQGKDQIFIYYAK
jgi:hypothetical protein